MAMIIIKFLISVSLLMSSMALGATITKCTSPSLEVSVNGAMLFLFMDQKQENCYYRTWSNLHSGETYYQCGEGNNMFRLTVNDDKEKREGSIYIKASFMEVSEDCLSVTEDPKVSDPYFASYVQEFVAYGKKYLGADFELGDVPINFVDRIVGYVAIACSNSSSPTSLEKDRWYDSLSKSFVNLNPILPQLIVDRQWWMDNMGAIEKMLSIFRVLSSCVLGRLESDDYIALGDDYIPTSIMNSAAISFLEQLKKDSPRYYSRILNAYYEELFTKSDDVVRRELANYHTFKNSY